jgi:hypothetical protein
MADKSKERAAKGLGNIIPLLGLGAQIATGIQSMKKRPKVQAEVPGYDASAVPAGIAQQGHGMGRGPALLAAFRAAGDTGQRLAGAKAKANYASEVINTQNEITRRDNIAAFGAGVGKALAGTGVDLVEMANARKAEREAAQISPMPQPGAGAFIGQAYGQGAEGAAPMGDYPEPADIAENPYASQQDVLPALQMEVDQIGKQLQKNKAEVFQLQRNAYGMPYPELLSELSPEIEAQSRKLSIAMEEIDKNGTSMSLALPRVARLLGIDFLNMMNTPIKQFVDEEESVV